MGLRIGEVKRLQTSGNGAPEAVLVVGGAQDVVGLFDMGGTTLNIPAKHLLFGKPQTIGVVVVLLPTFASSVPRIEGTMPVASRPLRY